VTDRLRAAALTLAVPVVAAMLAACGSGDGEAQDATSSSGGSSDGSTSTGEQRVGLELSVGECLADLGSEGTAADGSGAGDPSAAPSATSTTAQSTTVSTTVSTTTSAVAATSSSTSSSTSSPAVPTKASEIDTVDCDRKHVGEVFAQEELDDVLFPGQGPTQKRAADLCTGDGFTDFTGSEFDSSALDVVTYVPSKESWAAKDRTVSCVVTDPDGPTTGSLRDSYR
jgi:hypothetical protein